MLCCVGRAADEECTRRLVGGTTTDLIRYVAVLSGTAIKTRAFGKSLNVIADIITLCETAEVGCLRLTTAESWPSPNIARGICNQAVHVGIVVAEHVKALVATSDIDTLKVVLAIAAVAPYSGGCHIVDSQIE